MPISHVGSYILSWSAFTHGAFAQTPLDAMAAQYRTVSSLYMHPTECMD